MEYMQLSLIHNKNNFKQVKNHVLSIVNTKEQY